MIKKKTLVSKEGTKYQEFLVYVHEVGEWATCDTPHLYPETATMEKVKEFYPSSNFDGITMVTVEIKIVKE